MDAVLTEDEQQAEHERQKMYIEYLMMVHARSPQSDKEQKAQRKFAEELKPKDFKKPKKSNKAKVYKWDTALLERLKARQQQDRQRDA
ncbi:hypothetical protein [Shouchella tritolerans]|uniref:hypothetical protein n=1 Tax=Shouchella tritolerans TaxID=2979466 RepID=UPI0021E86087|nr:hypothetical protein [Shouchella tritolerans]